MIAPEGSGVDEYLRPLHENDSQENHHRVRRVLGALAAGLTFSLAGGGVGLALAMNTEAHTEIGGTEASIETTANTYDELDINTSALSFKKAHTRTILGEPVGVSVNLSVDTSKFVNKNGKFEAALLPTYVSLFSDLKQTKSDLEWALLRHDLIGLGVGATAGLAGYAAYRSRRNWRSTYDQRHGITPDQAAAAHAYHAPERQFRKRLAIGVAAATTIGLIPTSQGHSKEPVTLYPDVLFSDTAFQGVEIDGTLSPAIEYVEQYIRRYIINTNEYYAAVNTNLVEYLKTNPIELPTSPDIQNFGFVTDRHCNIGMDRVIMTLMEHYGIKILTSGGDDNLNGSFSVEAGCTSNLAEHGKKDGMTLVFTDGNHEPNIANNLEKKQGIKVLDNNIISVNGINFLGNPDPRTSRAGEGIQPSSAEAQHKVVFEQGKQIGAIACKAAKKLVVLLHDPLAGNTAIEYGCGNVMLALDGHTHKQAGPTDISLPDGSSAYQFVGGSTGGAPSEQGPNMSNPLASLTVGPLQRDAPIEIISENTQTGAVVAITKFTVSADKSIASTQYILDQPVK
jgi:hypothetical protein